MGFKIKTVKEDYVRKEIISGKHDEFINELMDKIQSYLIQNGNYNLNEKEDVLTFCKDFRGFILSILTIYVMEKFGKIYGIEIPDSKESQMRKTYEAYDKLKEKGLEDEYLNLVQWYILRPFTFRKVLEACWDHQPVIFTNGKMKPYFETF